MIILDADVILIERRYTRDPKFADNRRLLDHLRQSGTAGGVTTQALLETVGVLSFNVSAAIIPALPASILTQFQLTLIPNPAAVPDYAGCRYDGVTLQIGQKMSLGDAVQAVILRRYAPAGSTLITWNEPHFRGRVGLPVFTPLAWLKNQGVIP